MIRSINKLVKRILAIIITFVIIIFITTIYFTVTYPLSYKSTINKYSKQYNIDPYLMAAIINVESNYDKNAKSHKEARGLMQISPTTGQWAADVLELENFDFNLLYEPETNIMIGSWYLDLLSKEFDNNIQLMLAAYNGGSGNVTKWLADSEYCKDGINLIKIPFKETEEYVEKVQKNVKIYKIIYKDEFNREIVDKESYCLVIIHNFRRILKDLVISK